MNEKELRVGYEIHRLDNAIKKRIDGNLKKQGIDEATVTNGWVLKYLYDNGENEIYQKDIEKHFNIGRSTVTGIIQQMEKEGLVCRVSVENDARLKRVILLPKGEEIHKIIAKAIWDANRQIIEGVTCEELDVLLRILDKISNNFEERNNLCIR